MEYVKELLFLEEKIKPYLLSIGVGDGCVTTT